MSILRFIHEYVQQSNDLRLIHQNNTYTIVQLQGIGDTAVYCRPGGERCFFNLIFETRSTHTCTLAVGLVPPCPDTEHEKRRSAALSYVPEKYHKNTFIRLINFNALIDREITTFEQFCRNMVCVEKELSALKETGQTTKTWSRQNNRVEDWRPLFALLKQDLPKQILRSKIAEHKPSSIVGFEHLYKDHAADSQFLSFSRVLYLGSELTLDKGDTRTMDEMAQEALQNGRDAQEFFFRVIAAQIQSLQLRDSTLFFDDVSIVPTGGKKSSKDVYTENVRLSAWYHKRLLKSFVPDLVIIAGEDPMREYRTQVLDRTVESKTPFVLQVSNLSTDSYIKRLEKWTASGAKKNLRFLLHRAIYNNPETKIFTCTFGEGEWDIIKKE